MFCVVFPVSGCGSADSRGTIKVAYVEGEVTLDGKPLENAHVQFFPADETEGLPASGYSDVKGVYRLTSLKGDVNVGAVVGKYKVVFDKSQLVFGSKENPMSSVERIIRFSPEIYAKVETTPFTATVNRRKNIIPFVLKSAP